MKIFEVPQGTEGFLIVQEDNVDVRSEPWTVRKDLHFQLENVLVDPIKFAEFSSLYERGSLAADLAANGYIIFSSDINKASEYMIAVKYDAVKIS